MIRNASLSIRKCSSLGLGMLEAYWTSNLERQCTDGDSFFKSARSERWSAADKPTELPEHNPKVFSA